jgi:hypothetical protein
MGKREAVAQDLRMRPPAGAALRADNSGGGRELELRCKQWLDFNPNWLPLITGGIGVTGPVTSVGQPRPWAGTQSGLSRPPLRPQAISLSWASAQICAMPNGLHGCRPKF